jgi:carbamoyl-phosphate synthase small subunit
LLVLADGTTYPGYSFGAETQNLFAGASNPSLPPLAGAERFLSSATEGGVGEVVFNTGMSGYHEILTDPSYTGQIVAMTYPLVGNYGDRADWNEGGPDKGCAHKTIRVRGFVVRELYEGPVPEGRETLEAFLLRDGIPGITGVDTRALTLRLRDGGAVTGVILPPKDADFTQADVDAAVRLLQSVPQMEGQNLVTEVGTAEPVVLNPEGRIHFALIDCGIKAGIIRELTKLGVKITLLPQNAGLEDTLALSPDAVFFSNGPGDPATLHPQIALAKGLIARGVPTYGICLGHQIIALALGASTYKMPFGHHGVNEPVVDTETSKVYVTSQNHGFAVAEETLPAGVRVWFRNANDHTVEGLAHESKNVACVQFHPEASPGPEDTHWIIARFVEKAEEAALKRRNTTTL